MMSPVSTELNRLGTLALIVTFALKWTLGLSGMRRLLTRLGNGMKLRVGLLVPT